MPPSDRGSSPPRRRRYSRSPMSDRARSEEGLHHSGRESGHRHRSPDLGDGARRPRKEERRRRSPQARDRSRDRSQDRRRRRDRSTSRDRDGHRAEQRVKRRDEYERKRHSRDEREDKDYGRSTRRRRSHSRSGSPPPRRRDRGGRSRSRSKAREKEYGRPAASRSPPPKRRRRSPSLRSASPPPPRKARGPLVSQEASFRGGDDSSAVTLDKDGKPIEKQKPNFNATGLLAREANTVAGTNTVLKYHEPPEARKPPAKQQWRIFVFKGKDTVDTIHIYMRSCWLMGRDEKICDYFVQHPSTSKQHAVIQFRYLQKVDEFGERKGEVKPYLIDLESANGTTLNGKKVAASTYVELLDGDVVAFGESEREYVLMLPPP